jgi:hypothetical protein
MWGSLRNILSRSKLLNSLVGDIILETSTVHGQLSRSLLQWRLKKGLEENKFFFSEINTSFFYKVYLGVTSTTNAYIELDITQAIQCRASLDECIAEYNRLAAGGRPKSPYDTNSIAD